MPPKKIIKLEKHSSLSDSYSEDSDEDQKPRKSAKNKNRCPPTDEPPAEYGDDDINDNDIYNDDNRAYMKIANEIVTKNVKLPSLFDPNILPGFTALINNTTKVSAASRVLEASFKVYGKRVDVVHTEARKLDQEVISRTVEDGKQKKKPVEASKDVNESLNDFGGCGDPGSFSEEDEAIVTQKKPREMKAMNSDMANFDFDENLSIPSSIPTNSDNSLQFDDENLEKCLMAIAKDRTVLMGKEKRSAKEVEERLQSANAAAMEHFRMERLRRGDYKGGKKEESEEKNTANDNSYFHNSYYQYAMSKKHENRHVCIDDVAAVSEDYSRVYMHNQWDDENNAEWYDENDDSLFYDDAEIDGPDDGDFIHFPDVYSAQGEKEDNEDGDDILDGVLEQFQGTLELATADTHKLEDGWIEIFGLERKDLRPSNKTDVSFEQTANDDFDPEKRLVDRLVIEGEDEAMKDEEDRVEKLVKELFSGRIELPGGPGNVNEHTLRRRINSPTALKMYEDEDVFFPFDQSKYVTTESKNSQIAVSRTHFIKHRIIKDAKAYGLPDKLFEALQNFTLPITPIHEDILKIVETLPGYIFVKGLLNQTVAKYEYNQSCQMLSSCITPFRIARYVEQLLNSVIHQVQSSNLKQEFFDTRVSRAQSTLPHSSLYSMNTSLKKSRFNETFSGETYRYFAAFEFEKTQRYPNQIFNYNDDNQIYKIVSKTLSLGKGFEAFQTQRINNYFTGQAIFTLLAYVKFYTDKRGKDLSKFTVIQELPEEIMNDPEEASSVENNSAERDELLENLIIPAHTEGAPMEIDHDFDNEFDFHDAPTSPLPNEQNGSFHDAPNSSQRPLNEVISQALFASDNENGGGYDDADDFDGNLSDDIQQESTGTLDDSLAEIVRTLEVPITPVVTTRPKRNSKKIQFVEDESHWKKPANSSTRKAKKKKAPIREELLDQDDDNRLFGPRETSENVTTSRRRTPLSSSVSEAMEPTPRIQRCQDSSTPVNISNKFAFRLELGQTIPGFSDPDKTFVGVGFSEDMRRAFQSTVVLYRGEQSSLPPTSSTRQGNDFLFLLKTHRVCSDLTEAKKQESKRRKNLDAVANINNEEINYDGVSDDEYHNAVDHDFDAFDAPSCPPPNVQPRAVCDSFIGEYQHYRADDDDDDEEIDEFDFESKRNKMVTLHYSEGQFALKRAIKYILTKSKYDRTTLPDEISGIKAPPPPQITNEIVNTQMFSTSTPAALKKGGTFEIQYDDDVIAGDEIISGGDLQNDIEIDEEESDFDNDSDETRMKNFKVDGFHTLKSLLFYLPEVCHPDTVRVLSVAHVFCTLCHMANENSLCLIQEEVTLEGTETTSDCRILNLKDAEMLEAEEELDEAMEASDNESMV
uniref:Condensin complex subunit 2 n=1 Tax=Panagrolaimus davidi TaxID=227884 RepID=A0A914P5G5_9BILA